MRTISLILVCCVGQVLFAQQTLSLADCILLAEQHSLELQVEQNKLQQLELNHRFSKRYWHPSLYAFGNYNINFGRRVDPFTNTFSNSIVHSNSLGTSFQMSLFDGMKNKRAVQMNDLSTTIQKSKIVEHKISLKREVVEVYFSVLEKQLAVEQINLKLKDVEQQIKKNELLYQEGRSNKLDSLLFINQKRLEESNLKQAKLYLSNAITDLKTWINESKGDSIVAVVPKLNENQIIEIEDEITILKLNTAALELKSKKLALKQAKGGYAPQLSLSGSLGTGFSTNNLDYTITPNKLKPYGNQLSENLYESIGLNLSIPIYSKGVNKQASEQAQLDIELSNMQREILVRTQKQQINKVYTTYQFLKEQVELLLENSNREQTIFELTEEMFNSGRISAVDLELVRNKFYQSKLNHELAKLKLMKLTFQYAK